MIKLINIYTLVAAYVLCFNAHQLNGQSVTSDEAFYLELSNGGSGVVHELNTRVLSIQYDDKHAMTKDMPLMIYNFKHEIIAKVLLSKIYGVNHFNIDLDQLGNEWKNNEVYTCEAVNEIGKRFTLNFQLLNPGERKINVDIIINPKYIECAESSAQIQFLGEIDGAQLPYVATWYVMNENRSDFLYQPIHQKVYQRGYLPSININDGIDYCVILYVVDACGNEQYQVAQITCEDGKKKINTIFFEKLSTIIRSTK